MSIIAAIAAIAATIVSAATLALALPSEFAAYGIPALGFICLAPYFAALSQTRSYKQAAVLGFFFGASSHALSSYWLFFFQNFAFWTLGSTSIAYGCLHAVVAAILRRLWIGSEGAPGLAGSERMEFQRSIRPFLIAAAWTGWEWCKSTGFLGYPWTLAAYAVNDVPVLTQIADATGVYGLTFMLALSGALIVEAAYSLRDFARFRIAGAWTVSPTVRSFAVFAAVLVWFAGYGAYRLGHPTPIADSAAMVLVQHNGDSWVHGGENAALLKSQELSRDGLKNLREAGKTPVLVVWSETVLRRPFNDYKPFFRKNPSGDPLIPFIRESGVPLLTGAPVVLDWEKYDATNSAILIDTDANVPYSYAKSHGVPFAETIPFWEYQWMREFMGKVVGLDGGWVMGTEATVMEVPTPTGKLRFGVPICFEDAFAGVCAEFFRRGADILINITNDSWSKTVSAETQHFVASRFRSIENRRVLVRATNSGVTCVVDAEGRIVQSLPLFTSAALPVEVKIQKAAAPTVYFLLGDWLPGLCALALFMVVLLDYLSSRRALPVSATELIPDDEDAAEDSAALANAE